MTTNYSPVTTSASFRDAQAHMESAHTFRDTLHELYDEGRRDSGLIARCHNDIGMAMKLADVKATLAVAEELRLIRERLGAGGGS